MTDQVVLPEFVVATEPADDTCRTCRFWERFARWYGRCSNGDETGVFTSGDGGVFYPETFGCRFHRPKEAG